MDVLNTILSHSVALLGVLTISFALYLHLLANQANLSNPDRGYVAFHDNWQMPVAWGAGVGSAVGLVAGTTTELPLVTFIMGVLAAFLTLATITDIVTWKIPAEATVPLLLGMVTVAGMSLLTGQADRFPTLYPDLLPVFTFDFTWPLIAFAGVVLVLSVLAILFLPASIGKFFLMTGYLALVIAVYMTVAGLASIDLYGWMGSVFLPLLPVVLLLSVVGLLDLFVPDGIGGGDTILLYASIFGLGWWLGFYPFLTALLVGFFLQVGLHMVAKPLGIGYAREVPNGMFRQAVMNRKHKKTTGSLEGVTKTHVAHAVPFVPFLAFGIVAGTLFWLMIGA